MIRSSQQRSQMQRFVMLRVTSVPCSFKPVCVRQSIVNVLASRTAQARPLYECLFFPLGNLIRLSSFARNQLLARSVGDALESKSSRTVSAYSCEILASASWWLRVIQGTEEAGFSNDHGKSNPPQAAVRHIIRIENAQYAEP